MYLSVSNVTIDKLNNKFLTEKGVELSLLRLDKIHEEVSGNKLFKLHYYVERCLQTTHKKILTFGGAYSNHLAATAFLCKEKDITCTGIVRGEQPKVLSHTLRRCQELGMQLNFISRKEYTEDLNETNIYKIHGICTIIPEGGYDKEGAKGASLIMDIVSKENFTHVCTCVGTATTLAGLIMNNIATKEIIAIPAIKNMTDIDERVKFLTNTNFDFTIWGDYHFGGYAKYNDSLIQFMNDFYDEYKIPTDFVYTAKMMYGIIDKINSNYFERDSKILCLHTGGLQGNKSLKEGLLNF
jgi:1-aminocyclopropane-1-carboxylate deaminase